VPSRLKTWGTGEESSNLIVPLFDLVSAISVSS
jgi:hypothetical protein